MGKLVCINSTFLGELFCLLLAAPALYFPNWFPSWAPWASLALLGAGWLWRWRRLGQWWTATPADWPLFLLFAVLLPIAVWAAPPILRDQYAIPRSLILLWNLACFGFVVAHGSRRAEAWWILVAGFLGAGMAVALLAMLGTKWPAKLLLWLVTLLEGIPTPLVGVFDGAQDGFSANQVAGALLFVLPLALVVLVASLRIRHWLWWIGALGVVGMIAVMLATQSRSGWSGLAVGVLVSLLLPWRWGRWLLLIGGGTVGVSIVFKFDLFLALTDRSVAQGMQMQAGTLLWRGGLWASAITAVQDFRFTGMGLGTFRKSLDIYPPFLPGDQFDLAHAHNFFLQQALDFGVAGLIVLLAVYMIAVLQIVELWHASDRIGDSTAPIVSWRTWAIGFAASLAAHTVYSQTDAVAMGSKPNILLWWLLALVLGGANLVIQTYGRVKQAPTGGMACSECTLSLQHGADGLPQNMNVQP